MERVFSGDDIADSFWAPPPPPPSSAGGGAALPPGSINRSPSEWYFQKFLEEASVLGARSPTVPAAASAVAPGPGSCGSGGRMGGDELVEIEAPAPAVAAGVCDQTPEVPRADVDPEKYAAHLKQQLTIACAAVARTRVSNAISQEPSLIEAKSQTTDSSQLGSQASVTAMLGTRF